MAFDIRKKEWSGKKLGGSWNFFLQQMSEPVEPSTVIGTVLPEIRKDWIKVMS